MSTRCARFTTPLLAPAWGHRALASRCYKRGVRSTPPYDCRACGACGACCVNLPSNQAEAFTSWVEIEEGDAVYGARPSPCRRVQAGDPRCERYRTEHGFAL